MLGMLLNLGAAPAQAPLCFSPRPSIHELTKLVPNSAPHQGQSSPTIVAPAFNNQSGRLPGCVFDGINLAPSEAKDPAKVFGNAFPPEWQTGQFAIMES